MATDWEQQLDPAERLDYIMDFAGGDEPVLAEAETIASYSLAVTAQGALYGLTIESDAPYAPALAGGSTQIKLWLSVDVDEQSNPLFSSGLTLGVVATIVTSSVPARRRERTFNVEVKQL